MDTFQSCEVNILSLGFDIRDLPGHHTCVAGAAGHFLDHLDLCDSVNSVQRISADKVEGHGKESITRTDGHCLSKQLTTSQFGPAQSVAIHSRSVVVDRR